MATQQKQYRNRNRNSDSSTLQPSCNPATQQSFDSTPCFVLCLGFAMLALPANYKCNIAMAMPPGGQNATAKC